MSKQFPFLLLNYKKNNDKTKKKLIKILEIVFKTRRDLIRKILNLLL